MLTDDLIERIATAIAILRPEWNVPQIKAVLNDPKIRNARTSVDAARAMVWIATDSASKQPTRILANGPWWEISKPFASDHNTSAHIPVASPTDCDICSRPRERCELDDSHEYVQRNRRDGRKFEVFTASDGHRGIREVAS